MKSYVLFGFFLTTFIFSLPLKGQVIENPDYEECSPSNLSLQKVELSEHHTMLYLQYESTSADDRGGSISSETYLHLPETDEAASEKLKLEETAGIPMAPQWHSFDFAGQTFSFRLTFPPLPHAVSHISLIEGEKTGDFRINKIALVEAEEETNSFRADYDYLGIMDKETEKFDTLNEEAHTFVFNINENGDIKHYYSNDSEEVLRTISSAEKEEKESFTVQKVKVLDEEGKEMKLMVFSNGVLVLDMIDDNKALWFFTEENLRAIYESITSDEDQTETEE